MPQIYGYELESANTSSALALLFLPALPLFTPHTTHLLLRSRWWRNIVLVVVPVTLVARCMSSHRHIS